MRRLSIVFIFLAVSVTARAEELAVVGTGDGIEMLQAVASRFRQTEPSIEVTIPQSIGSGGGIAAVGSGTAKLARVARTLSDTERARGLVYLPVAKIPSAFFVHPGTGVTKLDTAQLADIYAGRISNWKDVGGPDLRIRVVRREDSDSTLTALRQTMRGWRDLAITERSKTAVSTQEAVESVRLTEGAIGFGPYSKVLDIGTQVLTIDGHHPSQPGYPSNGELAFVYRADALTPAMSKFIAFSHANEAKAIMLGFGAMPSSP